MSDDSDSGIANSFTDLMTSLAVIFILLLCAFMNNAFEEGQGTRIKILDRLQLQLKEFVAKGVKIESYPNDPLALLILVPEGLLQFQLDRSEIPPPGVTFLYSFIPKLANIIYSNEFRDDVSSVVVEGHTDSWGSDDHNLKLSQDRSMAVVSKCINILDAQKGSSDNGDEKKDYFLRVLSASGRGKQDLIKNNGEEDHQQSRRVVFKIRVRSFEEKKIEILLNNA
ncbi:MAG TPA: OmpA family protein [Syntrophales bacterium]|nr:OmpA family protein [Syntrophales bacterium]